MPESITTTRRSFGAAALAAGATLGFPAFVRAAEARAFSFGYDQPHDTGYGFFADRFAEKLAELSGGSWKLQQYPGAQLGSEPEMAQKVRSGDLDFCINSTANAAAVSPQAGAFSLEYIFPDEKTLVKAALDRGAQRDVSQAHHRDRHRCGNARPDHARPAQHVREVSDLERQPTSRAAKCASRRPGPKTSS